MSKKDDALRLALEALMEATKIHASSCKCSVCRAVIVAQDALAEQPCTYPNCPYPCPDLPDCRDAEKAHQEPVAWLHPANATCVTTDPTAYARGIPLYTSPPASKPLTGILSIAYSGGRVVTCSFKTEAEAKAFEQYAIEVAHQIGVNK